LRYGDIFNYSVGLKSWGIQLMARARLDSRDLLVNRRGGK
jgi:hypothetical protein